VPPEGFFSLARIKVDSGQAFRIADKEAGLAHVGFDTLDFRLRTREFTEDAVWTIKLRNADDEIVGNVDISASTAKILRAVWYYRDAATDTVRILDTAWPGGPKPSTSTESAPARPSTPAPSAPSGTVPSIPSVPLQPLPPAPPVQPGTYDPEPLPPVPSDPGLQPSPEPLPVPPPNPTPSPKPYPMPAPSPGTSPTPANPYPSPAQPSRPAPAPSVPRLIPR
jgi:hypothetical protein